MNKDIEIPVIDTVKIGARIKNYMKRNSISAAQMGEIMGFTSPQAVYKWLSGKDLPKIDNLVILARMFDTTVEGIILGDEDEPSHHIRIDIETPWMLQTSGSFFKPQVYFFVSSSALSLDQ